MGRKAGDGLEIGREGRGWVRDRGKGRGWVRDREGGQGMG